MNYMNGSHPSLELILRNYASHVFGSTILLGIAVLVAFHNPIARKISAGLQRRLLVARTPITDGRGSKSETLNNHTAAQRLHSLVIGIDTYPSLAPLRGAVNDASDVATYLMSDLGVPANQVAVLCNEEATRKRIIQEFQALANNPNIENGDPILIYYAGHGGLTEASVEWKGTHGAKQIQVIFPFDYLLKDPESAEPVNCIPDKTMGGLLNELSSNKGDNITVIFDSCHSASGTRANSQKGTDLNRRERSADVKVEIPPNIDSDLFAPDRPESHLPEKKHRDAELLLYTDQTSHIHLAACGPRQKAIEENGRGVFTAALLKKLRESRVDNITYHNLLKSLEMSCEDQSPQCYGKHKNRIIFNSRVSSSNKTFVPVDFEDGEFILAAGEASGVTLGSIWELHQSPTEDSPSVGQFTISELYGSVAILEPTRSISNLPEGDHNRQLYARCVHVGPGNELRVWISPDDRKFLFQDREQVGGAHDSGVGYVFTPTREAADVALEIHHQGTVVDMTGATQAEVIFYWCDDIAAKYGASKLKQRKPARREEVEIVLFAAAKWRWHLRRGNSRGRMVDQEVVVNMLKVANRVDRRRTYLHTPEPAPMNADGVVDIFVEKSALYGFRLESRISQPLYVRMFYFDATDFSISDMFGHNTAKGESTPNVAPRGRLLIGSGTDGGTPVKFNISPGSQVELGYMKVFWSTEPLELDHMGQISAFKMKAGDMRGADVDRDSTDSEWGTVCLPVVLRQ